MIREAGATGRVLIVDETRDDRGSRRRRAGHAAGHGFAGRVERVASRDSFIPLGDAALHVLLSEDTIEAAAIKLARG